MSKVMSRCWLAVGISCLMITGVTPISGAQKLPYPAREAVRRQKSNLEAVVKTFESYQQMAEWKAYPRKVEPGLGLTQKLDSIISDLEKNSAPDSHPDVAAIKRKVKEIRDALPALEKTLREKHEVYQKLADIKNYPHFDKDVERMKELYLTYKKVAAIRIVSGGRGPKTGGIPLAQLEDFKKTAVSYESDRQYFNGTMKRYATLMKVNATAKKRLYAWAEPASRHIKEFGKKREEIAESLPESFTAALSAAEEMAQRAKAERKAAFFRGGVKQQLDRAAAYLVTCEAIKGGDDEGVKRLVKLYNEKKKAIDAAEESLATELLAAVKTPSDVYAGRDKRKLLTMVKKEWSRLYPQDEVLAIRFHQVNWKRNTSWKVNEVEWYKVDQSTLAVSVIVKKGDTIAVIFPAYLNKDHQKNDEITVGAYTKKPGYVHRKMLLKNLTR